MPSQAQSQSRSLPASAWPLRAAGVCFLLAGLALLIPLMEHVARVALTSVMLGTMMLYLVFRRREGPVDHCEVFIPFSLMYITSFGFAAIFLAYHGEALFRQSLADFLTPALVLATLGYFGFAAGYGTLFSTVRPSALAGFRVRREIAVVLAAGVGFAGMVARLAFERQVHTTGGISAVLSTLSQFAPVFFFGWFLAWYRVFRGRTSASVVSLLLALPLAGTIMLLSPGYKELTITILGFPLVAYWYARRRIPTVALSVVLSLLVFVIFPIYNTYRSQSSDLPSSMRMSRTVREVGRWDAGTYVDRSVLAFAGRVATITSTAAVLRDVPRWVDYKYGETLILAPVSVLIPRILWPDKPRVTISREFAETFNLINPNDKETSIASTWVGELFWNFHVPGVLIGMFLIGGAYRWIYKKYGEGTGDQQVRWAVYATMMTAMLHAEGDLAANIAGMVKLVLMLAVLVVSLTWIGAIDRIPTQAGGD